MKYLSTNAFDLVLGKFPYSMNIIPSYIILYVIYIDSTVRCTSYEWKKIIFSHLILLEMWFAEYI